MKRFAGGLVVLLFVAGLFVLLRRGEGEPVPIQGTGLAGVPSSQVPEAPPRVPGSSSLAAAAPPPALSPTETRVTETIDVPSRRVEAVAPRLVPAPRSVETGKSTQPAPTALDAGAGVGKSFGDALREAHPKMLDCYEQGLRQRADLEGRVTLLLAVEARDGVGRVVDAEPEESETSLDSVFVQSCLLDVLSGIDFPAPPGGGSVTMRYPLTFRPKSIE